MSESKTRKREDVALEYREALDEAMVDVQAQIDRYIRGRILDLQDDAVAMAELALDSALGKDEFRRIESRAQRLDEAISAGVPQAGRLRDMSVGELLVLASEHIVNDELALLIRERGEREMLK